MYKDDHATEDVEEHYHYAGRQARKVFEEIVNELEKELPEGWELLSRAQGYKVVNEKNRQQMFFNCYWGSDGFRIKIIPGNKDFFENIFELLVESIEEPESSEYRFPWEAFEIIEGTQKCSICGKEVQKGDFILIIKNPYSDLNSKQTSFIKKEFQLGDVIDFRVCMNCAGLKQPSYKLTYILPEFTQSLFSDREVNHE